MPKTLPRFAASLPADATNIGPLRRGCAAYAADHGLRGHEVTDLELAVGEALSNVVMHAYRFHGTPGHMRVQVWCADGHVVVAVSDDGAGFAPRTDSPGAGLGLRLIDAVADGVEIRPADGGRGTAVSMAFRAAG